MNKTSFHLQFAPKGKGKESTCRNSRTFEPSTRKMVSYPDSWQNSKNILPNICKISPASTSAKQNKKLIKIGQMSAKASFVFYIKLNFFHIHGFKVVLLLTKNFACSCNKIICFGILIYDSNEELALNIKLSLPPENKGKLLLTSYSKCHSRSKQSRRQLVQGTNSFGFFCNCFSVYTNNSTPTVWSSFLIYIQLETFKKNLLILL